MKFLLFQRFFDLRQRVLVGNLRLVILNPVGQHYQTRKKLSLHQFGFGPRQSSGEVFGIVLDDLFEHQNDVFETSKDGKLEALFLDIAARHGIADKKAFDACLANRSIRQRIADTLMTGDSFGVRATPTFIVNGKVKMADGDAHSADAFETYLNAELEKLPQ